MQEKTDKLLQDLGRHLLRFLDAQLPVSDPEVFERFRAFRASSSALSFRIDGISQADPIRLAELRGIDGLLERLRQNTEQLLEGFPANHALLYGPRGTGKSSAVKALLNEYGDRGLRIIEVKKEALFHFPAIADHLRERPEAYILFCDDLAFDEEDRSYRELKAVLEGGIAARPSNLLIYATSNRRHLMKEQASDNIPSGADGDLHPSDALEEKISLSDRFGLRLGFPQFDPDTFLEIVAHHAAARGMCIDPSELRSGAMTWSRSHGSYSGRTARQYVDDLQGRLGRGSG